MEKRTFSYSKILDYATCPQKYHKRRILKIKPKTKSKPLIFGGCTAEGLRAYRREGTVKAAQEAFIKNWEKEGSLLKLEPDPDDPKDFRTVRRGLELMEEYAVEYPNDPKEVVAPEVRFDDLHLGTVEGIEVDLTGIIDGVLATALGQNVLEDKTTSQLGETFLPKLSGSMQVGIYLWAADQLGLFNVGGVQRTPRCLMNAMRVHPTEFRFKRDVAIKSRPHLELVRQNALSWVQRILISEEDDAFPLNDVDNEICNRYGGCEYRSLRYKEGAVYDNLLKNEFQVGEDGK